MKNIALLVGISIILSCNEKIKEHKNDQQKEITSDSINEIFKMVFVSCSDQDMEQPLWIPILDHEPDLP